MRRLYNFVGSIGSAYAVPELDLTLGGRLAIRHLVRQGMFKRTIQSGVVIYKRTSVGYWA